MSWNPVTEGLAPYPMEEFALIKKRLIKAGKKVYDFSTGDPLIPTWEPLRSTLAESIAPISQYPSVRGLDDLRSAHFGYLNRRFGIKDDGAIDIVPTFGSKEAIFHVALSLVGRAGGRKHIIYPNPGYPVYRSSTIFAGGIPYPVDLDANKGYLLEPWNLPAYIQKDAAAIWINYPHNPTGAMANPEYLARIVEWAKQHDVVLLSDECYLDIYDPKLEDAGQAPQTVLQHGTEKIFAFMSLSKRSGVTGFRCGMMAGDGQLLKQLLRARANFGVGVQDFVQRAAIVAWNDDDHVAERRKIFVDRIDQMLPRLHDMGFECARPDATFYLWAKLPAHYKQSDVKFCMDLAEQGVIVSPSQWLSEGVKGYVRFALVPDTEEINTSCDILQKFLEK